jgi:hypothetical protein
MKTTKREKAATIIQALLNKTTENGASEAEAMAAAEKARELMDRYRIDRFRRPREEGIRRSVKRGHYKTLAVKDHRLRRRPVLRQQGLAHQEQRRDALLRPHVRRRLRRLDNPAGAVRGERRSGVYRQPAALDARPRWEAEKAFVLGACVRISERLMTLTAERKKSRQGSGDGRSLVVVKDAIVTREFAKLDMKLRSGGRSKTRAVDGGAFNTGRAAGDRASFGKPVNGGGKVAQIGGKA